MYINWFEIPVSDFDKAEKFYSSVFGLKIERHTFDGESHGHMKLEEGPSGVIVHKYGFEPGKGVTLYFHVTDISEILGNVEAAGGKVLIPKTLLKYQKKGTNVIGPSLIDNRKGYFAKFSDPDGNEIALHSNA